MEHIKKTLEAVQSASATNSTTSPDATLKRTAIPTSWVSALFKHFQVIYGHKFNSMIDGVEDLASSQWASSLEGLTGEQIKSGLRQCGVRKIQVGQEDWPPTPAEFRAMCLPEKVPYYHKDYVALPRPERDPELVENSLSKMRKILG